MWILLYLVSVFIALVVLTVVHNVNDPYQMSYFDLFSNTVIAIFWPVCLAYLIFTGLATFIAGFITKGLN